MGEVAHQETDSIKVALEIDGSHVRLEAEIKDEEVFPPVDWGNKRTRAVMVDMAANCIKGLLSSRQAPAQPVRMVPAVCQGCGKTFEVEEPCCGEKVKQVKCPYCGKPQLLMKRSVRGQEGKR